MVFYIFLVVLVLMWVIMAVAFLVLVERHLLGNSQLRKGPSKVGFCGILQAVLDGLKLLSKEKVKVFGSLFMKFSLVPLFLFVLMGLHWFVISYFYCFYSDNFLILLFLCLMGLGVYGMLLAGIVSKSKFSIIGSIRAASQVIAYEVILSVSVLSVVCCSKQFYFEGSYFMILGFIFILFFMGVLAELGRVPFDFVEGESELVSGINLEYSSVPFVLFFLSEYGMLLFYSVFCSILFFGSNILGFVLVMWSIIFIRSVLPRFRYDFLLYLFWCNLLPVVLIFLFSIFMMVV